MCHFLPLCHGSLTEGEGSVQLTSLYFLFEISSLLYWKLYLPFFTRTSYLNEEVNCTEPSPSVSVPWLSLFKKWARKRRTESQQQESPLSKQNNSIPKDFSNLWNSNKLFPFMYKERVRERGRERDRVRERERSDTYLNQNKKSI